MSQPDSVLRALEGAWQLTLPEAFHRLYHAFEYPFINPCEFLALDTMRRHSERWRGMLPQFLPFGHDGADDVYGFYVSSGADDGDFPVLFWDHEYDHYYPLASGFDAFLRWCVVSGRYLAQDSFDGEDAGSADEEEQRREFAKLLHLPATLATDPLPRNDREMYERLLASDPQGAYGLAQLGSICLGHGGLERARDYFARASEAAPWFADPYYLLAETYRREERWAPAVERWWKVLQCPIALSTRTSNYDLGEDHPEAEIAEACAEEFQRHSDAVPAAMRKTPLFQALQEESPYSPPLRLSLGHTLERAGDADGAEREYLNALTLSTEEDEIDRAYERLIALYERTGRRREAEMCRRDAEAP